MRKTLLTAVLVAMAAVTGCSPDEDRPQPTAAPEAIGPVHGKEQTHSEDEKQADRTTNRGDTTASESGPSNTTGVPRAQITVDGSADDWSGVPVLLHVKQSSQRPTNYDCRTIKIARDEENFYILMTLGRGIREKFDQDMQQKGKASSGAVGYLHLTTDDQKYVFWIPTGFQSSYASETDEVVNEPWASFDVARAAIDEDAYDPVFEAESNEQPEAIAFKAKHLELAVPWGKMGLQEGQAIEARLEEM